MSITQDTVQAREATVVLPTYALKGQNRSPVFRSQYGVAHIYPYTLLDDFDNERREQAYHVLELENQYLLVKVITDLGGRVYSVFDKVSQCDVFYRNSIVRFAPLAIRGAFFSGGIEFSFPVAHAPTTCDKVNWDFHTNVDGSASISVGGLEHISGLRWLITLTLFPGLCALAQDVCLYNPGTIPGRYHYWTNASLDANDGTEFIYPVQRVRSYEYAGTASWPFARLDLIQQNPGLPGMEGVPMWPAARLQDPVNFRWQKNMLAQVSIFGRRVNRDYFGAWQHQGDRGYAHVASSRDVAGMKLWSWGKAPVGVVNQTALTDDGSLYAETQCGAMETQLDFDFMPPGGKRNWREWWLPLRGIGGLTCASETVGARLGLKPAGDGDMVRLEVALCPARSYDDAFVTLEAGEQIVLQERFSMAPEQPWLRETTLVSEALADKPLKLVVRDSGGNILLENAQDRTPSQIDPPLEALHSSAATADDFFRLGAGYENLDNRDQARDAYSKALALSEDHREAHLRLGLMLLRAAQLQEADAHLARAEQLGLPEGSYYRGIIALYEGRSSAADAYLVAARKSEALSVAALLALGRLALQKSDWNGACRLLSEAAERSVEPVTAETLLATALRKAGRADEAYGLLQRAITGDPLNHAVLNELVLGSNGESTEAGHRLRRLLGDDDQYSIDLACYYASAGLTAEALAVLAAAWSSRENVMCAYLAAHLSHRAGDLEGAVAWLKKAAATVPEFGFPSRLEEVLALQWAILQDPHDSTAKYLLGNFLYAYQRYDEAMALWRQAQEGLSSYDVLYRNLGLGAWQREHNIEGAIQYLECALKLNPLNQDLYLHLDELYKSAGMQDKRRTLLAQIQALTDIREDVHKHRIAMMVDLGEYKAALALIEAEQFLPLEMDQSFHDVYVRALRLQASDRLEAGAFEEAIRDYQRMLAYPESLGVGEPTTRARARTFYELGLAYEKLGRYADAIAAWHEAAGEHHPHGHELFPYVQMALDKLGRYSELGMEE